MPGAGCRGCLWTRQNDRTVRAHWHVRAASVAPQWHRNLFDHFTGHERPGYTEGEGAGLGLAAP
jgi:hypothetical protein